MKIQMGVASYFIFDLMMTKRLKWFNSADHMWATSQYSLVGSFRHSILHDHMQFNPDQINNWE